MFSRLLILSLLVGNTVSSPVSRAEPAASRDVTPFFQLTHEDPWENVNLTSMPCEDRKNKTWITLQLTNSSLTAFPVCLPEALETLDLSNNLLEELNGTEIANLPRLRVLSLRQNQLWSVRWGSEALSSLLSLDLSFNKLSSVPSCHSSALPNLRWLSLAGNPLIEIQPLGFSCYPQLQFLNLSATLLGQDDGRGIRESAFAISTSPSEATNRPGNINVLDLSRTFLEKIQPEWTRDLPNLRALHLTKMSRLRSLDTDFKSMPALQELNCQDSHLLAFVQTEMFASAPHLSQLSFENCNLSSFNPWNTNSSNNTIISLYGNPLICDCQLSWLLSKPKKVVLQKAWETFCYISQEDRGRPSTSLSLLELYNKCQSERNLTLPHSNTPSLEHDAFSLTSYDATTVVTTTDSAPLTQDIYISSLIQMNVMSTTAANPTELMLTKANSSSHKEEAVSQFTSTYEKEAVTEPMSTHKEEAVTESRSTYKEEAASKSMSTHKEEAVTESMSTHKEEAVTESRSTYKEEAVSKSISTRKEEAISESMSNSPSLESVTTSLGFLKLFYDQSSDHGSTNQTETDQLKTELRTTTAVFPREGTSNQPTTNDSATAMGSPNTTELHSFTLYVEEGTAQTSLPQLNSTRTTAHSQPASTRSLIHYVDDYDYDEQSTQTPVQVPYTSCDYNPCRHLQKPCSELQRESRCLCPGVSREDEVPDAPRLREVSEVTDSSAQIRWCAPNSVVHTYELMFHAQGNEDRQLVLDNICSTARQHTLYNLLPYTTYHICVTASNKAGSSQTSVQGIPGNSCTRFKTKPSYKSVFAALSAASGLFLISTIILSVCLCKACKKPQSEQYGTHLVSYKNPAFDYPLKLQTSN